MKITKAQLKQIIKEEIESIAGQDVPNEIVYPAIIAGFTEVLNRYLGKQYNFYKELNDVAEYYAKNFGGDEQAAGVSRKEIRKAIDGEAKNNQDNYGGTWNEAVEKAVNDYGDDFPEYMEVAFEIGDELKVDED